LDVPPDRGAALHEAPATERIAAVGGLDLDDLGAELAEDTGGRRTGEHGAHVEDADADQWAWG
jgi:hypothetical protein